MKTRIITGKKWGLSPKKLAVIITIFTFLITQCGLGLASPIYKEAPQNLRPTAKAQAKGGTEDITSALGVSQSTKAQVETGVENDYADIYSEIEILIRMFNYRYSDRVQPYLEDIKSHPLVDSLHKRILRTLDYFNRAEFKLQAKDIDTHFVKEGDILYPFGKIDARLVVGVDKVGPYIYILRSDFTVEVIVSEEGQRYHKWLSQKRAHTIALSAETPAFGRAAGGAKAVGVSKVRVWSDPEWYPDTTTFADCIVTTERAGKVTFRITITDHEPMFDYQTNYRYTVTIMYTLSGKDLKPLSTKFDPTEWTRAPTDLNKIYEYFPTYSSKSQNPAITKGYPNWVKTLKISPLTRVDVANFKLAVARLIQAIESKYHGKSYSDRFAAGDVRKATSKVEEEVRRATGAAAGYKAITANNIEEAVQYGNIIRNPKDGGGLSEYIVIEDTNFGVQLYHIGDPLSIVSFSKGALLDGCEYRVPTTEDKQNELDTIRQLMKTITTNWHPGAVEAVRNRAMALEAELAGLTLPPPASSGEEAFIRGIATLVDDIAIGAGKSPQKAAHLGVEAAIAARAHVATLPAAGRATGAAAAGKALVVDDSKGASGFYKEVLTQQGFDVDVAEDAKTAIQMLNNNYDLVMTDWRMRGGGAAVVNAINAMDDLQRPAVIVNSGTVDEVTGVDRSRIPILAKPVLLDDLLNTINQVMSARSAKLAAVAVQAAEPVPVEAAVQFEIGKYSVTIQPDGKIDVVDTESGQLKTVTVEELRDAAAGRAIVVVDNNKKNREDLVNILKGMQVFEKVADANQSSAESVIKQLQADNYTVFVLNNSYGVTPAFDTVDTLAVIDVSFRSVGELEGKAAENAVYARLAIFV